MCGETNWVEGDRQQTLGEHELAEVEAKPKSQKTHRLRTIAIFEAEWSDHQPLVEHLRRALFTDYLDVLAEEIKPDPRIRGEHC